MANYPATNNLADVVVTNPGPLEDSAKLSDAILETRRVMVAVIEQQHDSFGNILPASVTSAMLAPNAVTSTTIVDETITAAQIGANTITAEEMANNTLSDQQIVPNGITNASIADATIGATQLAPGAVGQAQLANGAVGQAQLASGLNIGGNLAPNSVPLSVLAPGSPGSPEILIVDTTANPPNVKGVVPSGDATMDATGKFTLTNPPTSRMPYILASEVQPSGTNGQTLTAGLGAPPPLNQGGWNLRNLNTLVDPSTVTGGLNSDRLSIPAGTYLVDAKATAITCSAHKAILVMMPIATAADPTTWVVLINGTSGFSYGGSSADYITTESSMRGVFTLAASAYIAILHQVGVTCTGGTASGFTPPDVGIFPNTAAIGVNPYNEVYTTLQLLKVA